MLMPSVTDQPQVQGDWRRLVGYMDIFSVEVAPLPGMLFAGLSVCIGYAKELPANQKVRGPEQNLTPGSGWPVVGFVARRWHSRSFSRIARGFL